LLDSDFSLYVNTICDVVTRNMSLFVAKNSHFVSLVPTKINSQSPSCKNTIGSPRARITGRQSHWILDFRSLATGATLDKLSNNANCYICLGVQAPTCYVYMFFDMYMSNIYFLMYTSLQVSLNDVLVEHNTYFVLSMQEDVHGGHLSGMWGLVELGYCLNNDLKSLILTHGLRF